MIENSLPIENEIKYESDKIIADIHELNSESKELLSRIFSSIGVLSELQNWKSYIKYIIQASNDLKIQIDFLAQDEKEKSDPLVNDLGWEKQKINDDGYFLMIKKMMRA